MSHYLIERIDRGSPHRGAHRTEVRGLTGDSHLDHVTLEHTATGEHRTVPCAGLFCFIGAVPATTWLGTRSPSMTKGFVLTDRSLPESTLSDPLVRRPGPSPVRDLGARRLRRGRRASAAP